MGNVREWLFTPLARFSNLVELNDWLAIRCRELAQRKHPCHRGRTINECFQEEQRVLRPIIAPFEGYVEQMMRVSNTSLVHVDRNRYSVPVRFARQAVSVHISANPIQVVAQAQVVATHQRVFGRDQLICDPWHYLPVLEKKPGALRNGVPFVEWDLPLPIQAVRKCLLKRPKGDRAFVELLLLAQKVGLEALTVACECALEAGTVTAPIIMNEMRRLTDPGPPTSLEWPDGIVLTLEPLADCQRYDHLLGETHAH
ncbi:Transposase [Mycoavidus cysteinexigens]|uniref:Transposase n=1 Tax=Mycoavidus cysteinexigens TaxID=1553431 RepID=A0A2Z6EX13_9BURK|nr:hypothetical protein [Mycoavidus cysteinexigens]BBE09993.1 Transposase [Mycoavidus cysteinexigens]GLR02269.1 hypothetical protein GCM10007934_20850 [Mycoavidus cysteinexigens]